MLNLNHLLLISIISHNQVEGHSIHIQQILQTTYILTDLLVPQINQGKHSSHKLEFWLAMIGRFCVGGKKGEEMNGGK
jgi:hypothetical protein